ncbi:MAG: MotA/TolQ/ExbB proton channel family protein [Gammaproteobacteria bacterium]|nr:MotA/TolQ/ExbB proton channel family protein [Gammaproteobacteria bacterium]MBP6051523.1 MotA/TolQ/ExbB proton channel family protein [Pseudomonadales bacterium]MBK6582626.1 MotA/TolQ/ExbB proton channel family protein [Gammaproteobacteria bacterium]MBK7518758.1 MotA/TolQ/ExbB proton channel family protein [Gammaproteobacteria bacterium]MBK7730495.1 MotA/TolQ/ExbB proton channel family protein [Gammaproteobacteria bacterium]
MKCIRNIVLGLAALLVTLPAAPSQAAVSMAELAQKSAQMRDREAKIWKQREAEQRTELQKQEQLARDALARRNKAEARSKALDGEWSQNEIRITDLKALLRQHEGNLGELFGVTRQIAGDAATVLQQSLITKQFPVAEGKESRDEFLRRLAGAKALPSIEDLERMWFELHREMTESGKVMRFTTDVVQLDKSVAPTEIVRVGPFTASAAGQFLIYTTGDKSLSVLPRQLGPRLRNIAKDLQSAPEGTFHKAVVDPARGPLLVMSAERPNIIERIQHGEVVGYVIVAVGVLGVLLAMFQYVYLIVTRLAVTKQLRDLSKPNPNNPLGRVLIAFRGDGLRPENPEIAELRLSEAVLRETPALQRFQAFLRLAVAAGPLLGLIGTVIGMIITFHAIVASGSSDPKLMAHGIGQAMIATVLGLGIAIPLLFINSGMTALSNKVTQVLDEQSQALLADELIDRNPFLTRELDSARQKDKQ